MILAVAIGLVASVGGVIVAALLAALVILAVCRVPYAGTPPDQIERILDALALGPGSRCYDLGCGDGRVVFAAAARGARATGFELQPLTYLRAKWRQKRHYPRAEIFWGDFRQADLSDADAVFCFLVDRVMPATAQWIKPQLRPHATVVSYGFPIPRWPPTRILSGQKPGGSRIYIYQPCQPNS